MAAIKTITSAPLVTDLFLLRILSDSTKTLQSALHLLSLHPSSVSPNSDDPSTQAILHGQKKVHANLARLRGQNRKLAQWLRQQKALTSASRSEIDTLHLSLQNLYYESRHLLGEIRTCTEFPHAYMELPMISAEEFLELEPEWIEKQREEGGESKLMEARIQREYEERMRLEEERKALVGKKAELMRENAKRKEELGRLDGELEGFIEAARPIQKTFEKLW